MIGSLENLWHGISLINNADFKKTILKTEYQILNIDFEAYSNHKFYFQPRDFYINTPAPDPSQ